MALAKRLLSTKKIKNKFSIEFKTVTFNSLANLFYQIQFSFSLFCYKKEHTYVIIDIDNTVNNQKERLKRFTKNGSCNYKEANRCIFILKILLSQAVLT